MSRDLWEELDGCPAYLYIAALVSHMGHLPLGVDVIQPAKLGWAYTCTTRLILSDLCNRLKSHCKPLVSQPYPRDCKLALDNQAETCIDLVLQWSTIRSLASRGSSFYLLPICSQCCSAVQKMPSVCLLLQSALDSRQHLGCYVVDWDNGREWTRRAGLPGSGWAPGPGTGGASCVTWC